MREPQAPIAEVFASFQGEGLYVGKAQVFVRFAGCDLRCGYCDTPYARTIPEHCTVHLPGGGVQSIGNPVPVERVMMAVEELLGGDVGLCSVALTGGEPLLYPDYINRLAPLLSDAGLEVYLETAGHLPDALERIIDRVDVISGDIKLHQTMERAVPYEMMARFWSIAVQANPFAKIVVTDQVDCEGLAQACEQLGPPVRALPVVLQPVTPAGAFHPPDPETLWLLAGEAGRWFESVRVLPQCHTLMGVR